MDDEQLRRLQEVARAYPGKCALSLQLERLDNNGVDSVVISAGEDYRVSPSEAFFERLKEIAPVIDTVEL